jgi:hypothetical protein
MRTNTVLPIAISNHKYLHIPHHKTPIAGLSSYFPIYNTIMSDSPALLITGASSGLGLAFLHYYASLPTTHHIIALDTHPLPEAIHILCYWFGYRYHTLSPHTHIYSCTPL